MQAGAAENLTQVRQKTQGTIPNRVIGKAQSCCGRFLESLAYIGRDTVQVQRFCQGFKIYREVNRMESFGALTGVARSCLALGRRLTRLLLHGSTKKKHAIGKNLRAA